MASPNYLWPAAPPQKPALPPGDIHVWCVGLEQPPRQVQQLAPLLNEAETDRANRFYFEPDRRRFIVSHGLLRIILGHYLGVEPARLQFERLPGGKPTLADNRQGLYFNLAHTPGLALYALARRAEIGVDVEQVRPLVDAGQIVQRFFSPWEAATWQALPTGQKEEAFFNGWTRKEAYLKARGEGLSHPLNRFSVSLTPGQPAQLLQGDDTAWFIQALAPAAGYVGAVAIAGPGGQVYCRRWTGPLPCT